MMWGEGCLVALRGQRHPPRNCGGASGGAQQEPVLILGLFSHHFPINSSFPPIVLSPGRPGLGPRLL
jgi:hypothetical protein